MSGRHCSAQFHLTMLRPNPFYYRQNFVSIGKERVLLIDSCSFLEMDANDRTRSQTDVRWF